LRRCLWHATTWPVQVHSLASRWARKAGSKAALAHADDGSPTAGGAEGQKLRGNCVRDPDTGGYAVAPIIEGRIVNLAAAGAAGPAGAGAGG
jgi:hypothetical protein